jgi:U2-associated protein SR140
MDSEKLSQFAQGTVRKSKREKEKEAADAKQKEEEENAAKAYTEFLDAFDGEEAGRKKTGSAFVRSANDDGRAYAPSMPKAQASSRSMRAFERVCDCASDLEDVLTMLHTVPVPHWPSQTQG